MEKVLILVITAAHTEPPMLTFHGSTFEAWFSGKWVDKTVGSHSPLDSNIA